MYRLQCDEKDITHGQRFLLDLIEKRKLKQLCLKRELSHVYTFNVGVGKYIPSALIIYTLRDLVHPVLWFYTETETLPELKHYLDDPIESCKYTDSLGFKEFHKLTENLSLRNWSIENGLTYSSIRLIAKGKRAPSYYRIKELRDKIYPADWFYKG